MGDAGIRVVPCVILQAIIPFDHLLNDMWYNKSIGSLQRDAGCFQSIPVYGKRGSIGVSDSCNDQTIAYDSPTKLLHLAAPDFTGKGLSRCQWIEWSFLHIYQPDS